MTIDPTLLHEESATQVLRGTGWIARPRTLRLAAGVFGVGLLAAACGSDTDLDNTALGDGTLDETTSETIESEIDDAADDIEAYGQDLADQVDDADLGTLFEAMDVVGFDDIAEAEAFTFFAPNDSAFTQLDADDFAELLTNPDELRGLLRNHLIDQTVTASELPTDPIDSTGGLTLTFDTSGETPTVNGIEIVRTDVTVDSGVIHVIDGVLGR